MITRPSPSRISVVLRLGLSAMALLAAGSTPLAAQPFDSGSTGADGALVLTTPGTVVFDPASFSPPLDPDGDNVYHFTSVTIGAGVTVRLIGPLLNMSPVFWLASGPVTIDGILDLSGENGHPGNSIPADRRPSVPGPGGYPGGVGHFITTSGQQAGTGPGGGGVGGTQGSGAGHNGPGCGGSPGAAYGNAFLLPLLGGSGGGGGNHAGGTNRGAGGGAGGGAVLLASSVAITVNGSILANGGHGGAGTGWCGGSGSGGAIHLLAPMLAGGGSLRADGGANCNCGAQGRIRLEAVQHNLTGSVAPAPARATVFTRDLTPDLPVVRALSVDGQPVPTNPDGSFTVPDVTINKGTAAAVAIEARNVPTGTVVEVRVYSEGGADQIVNSTPLAGTLALSSATASVVFPPGFSRAYVRARWTP
jgi:hypothetical protein